MSIEQQFQLSFAFLYKNDKALELNCERRHNAVTDCHHPGLCVVDTVIRGVAAM
jgi:hypothetical protein